MGTRDETVEDLQFLDQTAAGNPNEEGQTRYVSGDLVAYVGGAVKSLTAAAGGGITEGEHEALDTLAHNIAETSHEKTTRVSGRVTVHTIWQTSSMLKRVRELTITRASGQVSQTVEVQYDAAGVAIVGQTLTKTYNRVSGQVDSIDVVES